MLNFTVLMDFSAAATHALRYAIQLAREVDASVHIVCIVPDEPTDRGQPFQLPQGYTARRVEDQLLYLAYQVSQVVPATYLRLSAFHAELLVPHFSHATQTIVFIGNDHWGQPSQLGAYLLECLPYPVCVVPLSYPLQSPPRHIILDTDCLPTGDLHVTAAGVGHLLLTLTGNQAQDLALDAGGESVEVLLGQLNPAWVEGVHVSATPTHPGPRAVSESLLQMGLLCGVEHSVATASSPMVGLGIVQLITQKQADLLLYVTRLGPPPLALLNKATTEQLLEQSPIPILFIPDQGGPA